MSANKGENPRNSIFLSYIFFSGISSLLAGKSSLYSINGSSRLLNQTAVIYFFCFDSLNF